MKLFKALLGVGLGLSLLMGSAMAADEKPAKSEKKAAAGGVKTTGERISGEITKVDADAITVKTKDGSEKTFTLTKDAKVSVSKSATDKQLAAGTVADVKIGAFASVRATKDGDKLVVKRVTVAASANLLPSSGKATAPAAGADAPKKEKKAKQADATATPTPASN